MEWSPPSASGTLPASSVFSTISACLVQVAVISFKYLACGSPSFFCSGMATATLPPSSTTCPSASSLASSPATRTAEGPISTPRRDCPRSRGTPITRIFLGTTLENDAVVGVMGLPKISDFQFPISDSCEFNMAIGNWKMEINNRNQKSTIKNQQSKINNQKSTSANSSRVKPMQHPGEGNRFPHMLQAADPRHGPFNAPAKTGIGHAAVLASI